MKTILFAVVVLLSGCAGEVLPDYPSHDTAVLKKYVHNLGFKGMFASEGVTETDTRADMRRVEDSFQFSGFMMKHLVKARDNAHIWRVDKNLQWQLNTVDKTYTECPLTGCPAPERTAQTRPDQPRPQRPESRPTCALTLVKNKVSVKATGETKDVNGFPTSGYQLVWEIVAQDPDKNKTSSTVKIDLWTTPESDARIKAVRAVDRRFEAALSSRQEEDSRDRKVIPVEALRIMEMQFMSGFSAAQHPTLMSAAKELSKIHGYPISTTVNWFLDGAVCRAAAAPQAQGGAPGGLDLSRGRSGLMGGGAADDGGPKPVFGFVEEIRELNVEPASDGLFVPPPSYKLKTPDAARAGG